jgi:hypothetical protein
MEEAPFSWSTVGNTSPQPTRLMQLLETIPVLIRDNKLELQSNMANLRMEMVSAIADIHETIGDLKAEVRTMNNNFLLDSRKVLSSDYDERDISTFMSLDDLEIETQERPVDEDEEDIPVVAEEITIVEGGFTAPVPEKPVEIVSFENLSDEDIVVDIVSRIEAYLQETPVLMNFSFKKKSIIPQDYTMPKDVKALLKASVVLDDSPIRLHKLDRMRGMYYLDGVDDPELLYEETFN